jgi:hypothetical protein
MLVKSAGPNIVPKAVWSKYSNGLREQGLLMMDCEDEGKEMGADIGLCYGVGQSGTAAAE